ncbi:DNA repair endonuclease XPF [Echinococcus granulosus]|uniref:DNA repair endonuclease XPF n=1 Tax=Echinococcus granulosus TaxID=6210 RepID=A0A068WD95_ECHGR|nr:DNA repair endonuclease XPF [Echinococcus granulosus]CDS18062.1 dna repair endonuclease xpf [Echinococcus granulosus]
MSVLLDYEKNILLDVNEDSCMFVCAEGLDLDTILHTIIKLHNDPHNLVLISNYSLPEAKYIAAKFVLENEAYLPFIITANVSAQERLQAYRRGGVVFVSSRILVVDLLRGTMPVELVTGVLVLRCHILHESSQESFMLRLLRERNPQIFIKAFTDNAIALMSGYNRVEHLMSQFGVSRLLLWPRFNLDVVNTLSKCPLNVEEVQVFLTEESSTCQRCLLEMIKATLRELVDINPILNNDEFTLESALTNSFHQLTSLYIDPIWHHLTQTSHRLLADVAGLRRLLFQLIDFDAVTFLDALEDLRQAELSSLRMSKSAQISSLQRDGNCANWLLMSQAEQMLSVARSRVYNNYEKRTYTVEVPPKLIAITSILEDVIVKLTDDGLQQKFPVLILLRHTRSVELLDYYLRHGRAKLQDWLVQGRSAYEHPAESSETESPPLKRVPLEPYREPTVSKYFCRGRSGSKQIIACTGAPCIPDKCSKFTESDIPSKPQEEPKAAEIVNVEDPVLDLPAGCSAVTFTTLEGRELQVILRVPPPGCGEEGATASIDSRSLDGPAGRLGAVLARLRPYCVIFFEPRVSWIREVEVYAAKEAIRRTREGLNPHSLSIYFMVYKDSVEEQRYLTRLRREKEAFEGLITLRASAVVKKVEPSISVPAVDIESGNSSEPAPTPTVFVDVREFRSELPALLHRKGLRVNPITLTVGDYILAPHICVERKSVSDLISSLNSGRLFQQCTVMSRHYLNPVLLIEFSMPANGVTYKAPRFPNIAPPATSASFALFTGRNAVVVGDARTDLDPRHLLPRLVLLLLHFPRLRVLWSVTPYCTAELFAELKVGRAEPTLEQLPQDSNGLCEENAEAVEMLLRLPGISWRNYQRVMARVDTIADLAGCSLERLTEILENSECAQKLYNFLHSEWAPPPQSSAGTMMELVVATAEGKRPRFDLAARVKTRTKRK